MSTKWNRIKYLLIALMIIGAGIFFLTKMDSKEADETVITEAFEETKEENDQTSDKGGTVYVHICGEVKKPGVYSFDSEPRVIQVIEQAGGFTKKAETTSINQAEVVIDGAQIVVPAKAKKGTSVKTDSNTGEADTGDSNKVNINEATIDQLQTLSGIGKAKAIQIINYRETNRFKSIEDIMKVNGIKEGVYNQVKDLITV